MHTSNFVHRGLLSVAILIALAVNFAQAYPEPRIVTDSWQLEFDYDMPRVINVVTEADQPARTFWYMPYTVTNGTGADQMFIPDIRVLTNAGDIIQAGRNVPPIVFEAIKAEQRNVLLVSPIEVIGRLLQGEDNAKDTVAIWAAPEHDIDAATMLIKGLSGETTVVRHPETGEDIVLRKTLKLDFATPGGNNPAARPIKLVDTDWVMQ